MIAPKLPDQKRLPLGKRITTAIGMLAGNAVVLAADTQESDGYFKEYALKISSAMTHSRIDATVKSAVAITGAGPGVHLDAVSDEIINMFHEGQYRTLDAFQNKLQSVVKEFYFEHVAKLKQYEIDRDFRLIVGAQIEGDVGLWTTEATVTLRSLGLEAVGTGSPFAKMAMLSRAISLDTEQTILLAILGITNAKEHDHYSGKGTSVVCLKDNVAHDVPWYRIEEAGKLLKRCDGIEHSAFQYVLGNRFVDAEGHAEKIAEWLKDLRKDFKNLMPQLFRH